MTVSALGRMNRVCGLCSTSEEEQSEECHISEYKTQKAWATAKKMDENVQLDPYSLSPMTATRQHGLENYTTPSDYFEKP